MNPTQLRELINAVLMRLALQTKEDRMHSPVAVELLMLTAAQETHLGRYIRQIKGPALGIFQVEPASYDDLYHWLSSGREGMRAAMSAYYAPGADFQMNLSANIPFQIAVARLFYWRKPQALPSSEADVEALAQYYKKWWNTSLGKATVEEAITNYNRYVKEA